MEPLTSLDDESQELRASQQSGDIIFGKRSGDKSRVFVSGVPLSGISLIITRSIKTKLLYMVPSGLLDLEAPYNRNSLSAMTRKKSGIK